MPAEWFVWDIGSVIGGLTHRLAPDRLKEVRDSIGEARPAEALAFLAGFLVGAQIPITVQEQDRLRAFAAKAGIASTPRFVLLAPVRGDHAMFKLGREVLNRVRPVLPADDVARVRGDLDAGRWRDAIAHLIDTLARTEVAVASADRAVLLRLASSCGVPVSDVAAVPAAFSEPMT